MKNKYYFLKKLYKDYVVIFDKDGKWMSYSWDSKILEWVKNKDVNYIIVDSLFNVLEFKVEDNQYRKYVMKVFLYELIDKFK